MSISKGNCSVDLSPADALLYAACYEVLQPIMSLGVQLRPESLGRNLALRALFDINNESPILADWWTGDDPKP